jgi:hypothetical protein
LQPLRGDRVLAEEKRCELDRLYQRISDDLDALLGCRSQGRGITEDTSPPGSGRDGGRSAGGDDPAYHCR